MPGVGSVRTAVVVTAALIAGAVRAGEGPGSTPPPADRLLVVNWKGKYGLIDRGGRLVLSPRYDSLDAHDSGGMIRPDEIHRRDYSEGLRPVRAGGKWGYIDGNEEFVIPRRYDRAGPFRDGRAQVAVGERWGLIDRTGRTIIRPRYAYIGPFRDGRAVIAVREEPVEGGLPRLRWGLMGEAGRQVIKPGYDMAVEFPGVGIRVNEGGHPVNLGSGFLGGRWGVLDRDGRVVTPVSFELPTDEELEQGRPDPEVREEVPGDLRFAAGRAPIIVDKKWGYLASDGRVAIRPRFEWAGPFHDDRAAVRLGGRYGYIDPAGRWAIRPRYEWAGPFAGGRAWARDRSGLYGLDEHGAELVRVNGGQEAQPFRGGLAAVRTAAGWGFVDADGRWMLRPRLDEVRRETAELDAVQFRGKWGLVNRAGELACPPRFDWFSRAESDGRAAAVIDGPVGELRAMGMVDARGRLVLEPAFGRGAMSWGTSDRQTLFPRKVGDRWGFVDKAGKTVIEPRFEKVEALGEGIVAVRVQQKWGLVDLAAGRLVMEPKFYSIGKFSEGLAEFLPEPTARKHGYLDRAGRVVIEPRFQFAHPFRDGLAPVGWYDNQLRAVLLYVDRTGKYLWEPPKE